MVPYAADDDEWDDDESDDDESDDEADVEGESSALDEADAATLTACSQCGASIYDDSPRCPHCGTYLPTDVSPLRGRPWWWLALGLAGVAATVLGALLL